MKNSNREYLKMHFKLALTELDKVEQKLKLAADNALADANDAKYELDRELAINEAKEFYEAALRMRYQEVRSLEYTLLNVFDEIDKKTE